jgi:hypothetical protein
MHTVNRIVAAAALVAATAAPGLARANPGASGEQTPETPAAQALEAAQAEQANNSHAYRDVPQWRGAPAAGTEVGYGVVIPSLRAPEYSFQGRLGLALETPSRITLVLAGLTGVTIAFNTGGGSPFYGYLVRIPLMLAPEIVYSRLVNYANKRFLNLHMGLAFGEDFVLAAQCLQSACNYVLPSTYFGLGARVGLSYSAVERSAVGLFVSWMNDFAPCPASTPNCTTALSTLTWSVGWSLF